MPRRPLFDQSRILVSPEDEDLKKHTWMRRKEGGPFFRGEWHGINPNTGKRSQLPICLARIILGRVEGKEPAQGDRIEYINGDDWDHRRENLRISSRAADKLIPLEEILLSPEDKDLLDLGWRYGGWKKEYAAITEGGKTKLLHRIIMERLLGHELESDILVDHVNRKPMDNRRNNLRLANKQQNCCNASLSSLNKSGFRGVNFHKATNKWTAAITHKGVRTYIGVFENKEDAAAAYQTKSLELHGDFAAHLAGSG